VTTKVIHSAALTSIAAMALGVRLGAHGLAAEAVRRWEWEPITIALLIASAVLYAAGTRAVWRRAGVGRGIRRWQAISFAAGLLSLAVALLSPVVWLSTILFSMHMTQHEILMLVSAPLLVFGHPLFAMLWALPRRTREAWGMWSQTPIVARSWRGATGPFTVFFAHAVALWLWHTPPLYEAALHNGAIHALEHLSFVMTAALFWWAMIHGRYGRMGYGIAVLYIFLTAIHSSVLGALMTISPHVLYPDYIANGASWHVNAIEDQQLAGLLMWVPSGLVFIIFGLALFAAWLGESDKRVRLGRVALATSHLPLPVRGGTDDAA
jgi:cytochrome c oxidase assembly factor CtaG